MRAAISFYARVGKDTCGQATVEAAFLIPIMCVLLLILLQPALLMLDRLVIEMTINDVYRFVLTSNTCPHFSGEYSEAEQYALKRLEAIPDVSILHVGDWDIDVTGDEMTDSAYVSISHRLSPLPLIGAGLRFIGSLDGDGLLTQSVTSTRVLHGGFECSIGLDPSEWVSRRVGVPCTS